MVLSRCHNNDCRTVTFHGFDCPSCKTTGSVLRSGVNNLQAVYENRDAIRAKQIKQKAG